MGQLEAFLPFVEPEHVQALVRKDELGPLSFDRIVTPLASIRSLLEDAIPQEEEIPAAQLNAAVQQLNGIQEIERQIETFTVGEQNPSGSSRPTHGSPSAGSGPLPAPLSGGGGSV